MLNTMSKKIIILLVCSLSFFAAKAQDPFMDIPDHTPMMNDAWEKVNMLMYRVTKNGNETVYTPHFPPELKAMENQIVTLPGYLVPLNAGRTHTHFLISVLPIMQCSFCGTNDIPPMVEVHVKKGNSIKFSEDPIAIRGRVFLNTDISSGNSEIQIMDAEIVKYDF